MSSFTMKKSWPLLTTLLILLFGLVASATSNSPSDLIAITAVERRAQGLEVRAPKRGGGGGGGSGGDDDDDDDDEDGAPSQDFQTCPNGGTTCSECFGTGYISCVTPANVCYNPAVQTRSKVCVSQGDSGATQLAGSLGLGVLGLAVALL
ncbi:hypothetical protein GX51_02599 [Blastomyces parvus]|uniref:Uncharacterized protein n=1 Tax=Blastomyces parvus TaxID=2060905 RepID=A0A2B7XBJ0_9EURO|nr:hypothetical protein GX51_02599 [Blastomyces parvus]